MVVEIDGKQVAIYNTHLSLGGGAELNSNINEILEVMANDGYDYKLLTGDFNATRENMDPFKVNYNLANGNDGLWYSTFEGDKYADGAGYIDGAPNANITSGIDNIVYSRNLDISNVRVVHNDDLSDHFMVYADFRILSYEDDLQELVNSLDYVKEFYTEESWNQYAEALEYAQSLLKNTDSTELQDELKDALTQLKDAIEALKFNYVDKTDLIELVLLVKTDVKEETLYTPSTYKAYADALVSAEAVIANQDLFANRDEAIVEEAWTNLIEAWSNLRIKADKSVLKELLSKAETIDLEAITEESAATLRIALTKAVEVLDKEEATQEEVDEAVKVLSAALEVEYNEAEKPEDKVETGDGTPYELYIGIAVVCLVGAFFLLKKKKE